MELGRAVWRWMELGRGVCRWLELVEMDGARWRWVHGLAIPDITVYNQRIIFWLSLVNN